MARVEAVITSITIFMIGCSPGDPGEQIDVDTQNSETISDATLTETLLDVLAREGFTGNIQSTLQTRLGRPINSQLADLGRQLWFDKIGGLHDDNTCGGCHAPSNGF